MLSLPNPVYLLGPLDEGAGLLFCCEETGGIECGAGCMLGDSAGAAGVDAGVGAAAAGDEINARPVEVAPIEGAES